MKRREASRGAVLGALLALSGLAMAPTAQACVGGDGRTTCQCGTAGCYFREIKCTTPSGTTSGSHCTLVGFASDGTGLYGNVATRSFQGKIEVASLPGQVLIVSGRTFGITNKTALTIGGRRGQWSAVKPGYAAVVRYIGQGEVVWADVTVVAQAPGKAKAK